MPPEIGLVAKLKPEIDDTEAKREKKRLDEHFSSIKPNMDLRVANAKDRPGTNTRRQHFKRRAKQAGGLAKRGAKKAAHIEATRLARKMGVPTTVPSTQLFGGGSSGGGGAGGGTGAGGGVGGMTAGEPGEVIPLLQAQLGVQEEILEELRNMNGLGSGSGGDDDTNPRPRKRGNRIKNIFGGGPGAAVGAAVGAGAAITLAGAAALTKALNNFEVPEFDIPDSIPLDHPKNIPLDYPTEIPLDYPKSIPLDYPNEIPLKKPDWLPVEEPGWVEELDKNPNQNPEESPTDEPTPSDEPVRVPNNEPTPGPAGVPDRVPDADPSDLNQPQDTGGDTGSEDPVVDPNVDPQDVVVGAGAAAAAAGAAAAGGGSTVAGAVGVPGALPAGKAMLEGKKVRGNGMGMVIEDSEDSTDTDDYRPPSTSEAYQNRAKQDRQQNNESTTNVEVNNEYKLDPSGMRELDQKMDRTKEEAKEEIRREVTGLR